MTLRTVTTTPNTTTLEHHVTRLAGKTAIITGAATGIGAAAARRFVAEGARIGILDVNDAEGQALAAELGADAHYFHCDVADPEAAKVAVVAAADALGGLDIVFANAAIGTMHVGGSIEDIDVAGWDWTFNVNTRGVYAVCAPAIPYLRARGGGSIVLTASIFATVAPMTRPTHSYTASKGAVAALARAMACTYGPEAIRVNSLSPGLTRTRLNDDIANDPVKHAAAVAVLPLKRFGQPEELAAAALFLASDDSSFITGQNLIVDGGFTAA